MNPPDRSLQLRVEAVCERFKAAWRTGRRPSVESFVDPDSPPDLLAALHAIDQEYRRQFGETPVTANLDTSPDLESLLVSWLARADRGEDPAAEEICPSHAPDLLEPLRGLIEKQRRFRRAANPAVEPEPPVPAPPGFEIVREIARGGMGVVYLARDTTLEREVAIKVLRRDGPHGRSAAARFAAESLIAGGLQHPGIPPVHAYGHLSDGSPFLVMKLIVGRTLAEWLANPPPQAGLDLIRVFEQIAQTVGYAHSRGVIHRDLKPSNVMIGAFGEVQVMDWGLAKVLGVRDEAQSSADELRVSQADQTRAGAILGTPAFMPPEQARGDLDRVEKRSDVFALGGLLCVILTGKPPYLAANPNEAIAKAAAGDLTTTFARLDGCGADPELIALAKRCLHLDPAERPADSSAVATEVAAHRATVDQRLRAAEHERTATEARAAEQRRRQRWQLLAGLAALVLAVGAGAVAVAWWVRADRADRDLTTSVSAELADAERALTAERWADASEAVARADKLLEGRDRADLRDRIASTREWVRFALTLHDVQFGFADRLSPEGALDYVTVAADYEGAFRANGLDVRTGDLDQLAEVIRQSPIRETLVSNLDDWASFSPPDQLPLRVERIQELASRADADAERKSLRSELHGPAEQGRAAMTALLARFDPERSSPRYAQLLAGFLIARDRPAEGFDLYRRTLLHHPGDYYLRQEYGRMLGSGFRTTAETHQAVTQLTAVLAMRPEVAWTYLLLADSHYRLKEYDRAIELCRQALRVRAGFPAAHARLGELFDKTGKPEDGIQEYRVALAARPEMDRVRYALVDLHTRRGEHPQALALLNDRLQQKPTDARARYTLGTKQLGTGQKGAATEAYRGLLTIAPSDVEKPTLAYYLAAAANDLQRLNDWPLARQFHLQSFKHASTAFNNTSYARFLLQAHTDSEGAMKHVGYALERERADIAALTLKGQLHLDRGELEQAAASLAASFAQVRTAEALLLSATVLLKQGKYAEAAAHAREAGQWRIPLQPRALALAGRAEHLMKVAGQGKAAPDGTADDKLAWAELRAAQGQYLAAARLYREAFEAKPALIGPTVEERLREDAAKAALRAADAKGLSAATVAELQGWAVAWLRDDLTELEKNLAGANPESRWRVETIGNRLRRDPEIKKMGSDATSLKATLDSMRWKPWLDYWTGLQKLKRTTQAAWPLPPSS